MPISVRWAFGSRRTTGGAARSPRVLVLLTGAVLVLASSAGAQDGDPSSTEGAIFLLLPVGAQSVSLGRAMTAMRGPESAFWNPAGLAHLPSSRFTLVRGDHVVGTATAVSVLGVRSGLGAVGASYLLLDHGDQERRDDQGNSVGRISIRNHLGVASVATRLLSRLDAGLNFKVVQFRLSCRGICPDAGTTATTYALDAGIQLVPTEEVPLRFGAMVAHVGPDLQVLNAEQADPLPSRARVAVAYDVMSVISGTEQLEAWLAVELQDRLLDPGSLSMYVGSEVTAGSQDALFLRAGYVFGDLDQEAGAGARVGLGLRYERFELAIAKSYAASTLAETEPVHVTLSVIF